jgi:hypothetical protein
VQQDGSLTISKADSDRSGDAPKNPMRGVARGLLKLDIRGLVYWDVGSRVKAILAAAPKREPHAADALRESARVRRRWFSSRVLDLSPSERKWLAEGLRTWRRELRALANPLMRRWGRRNLLTWDIRSLVYSDVHYRAMVILQGNERMDRHAPFEELLHRSRSLRRRSRSRVLDLSPSERKWLADGLRALVRERRAVGAPQFMRV